MDTVTQMAADLKRWRKRNGQTQVEAATLLGISQTYLSLLEKGARPLTAVLRARMKVLTNSKGRNTPDYYRAQLSALGYPGFVHIVPSGSSDPNLVLFSVLAEADIDTRVVEALPWLVRHFWGQLDLVWLVRQAKLQNLQNRLGFVLQAAGAEAPPLLAAVTELERARLLQESTLCWDTMPSATRDWIRAHRTPLAQYWNLLTRIQAADSQPEGLRDSRRT